MVYMITYDLNSPGQNYDKIIEAIKSASTGKWISRWRSSWLIQSNLLSANLVYQKISPFIDNDDRIIVIQVVNNKQGWLDEEDWAFINKLF